MEAITDRKSQYSPGSRQVSAAHAAVAVGALVSFAGWVVVVGWAYGNLSLAALVPGEPAMKMNTAVLMICCGSALALRAARRLTVLAQVLCGFTIVVAGMSLIEYLSGHPFGIDELLVSDGGVGSVTPGRMGPNTATSLILVAASINCLDALWRRIAIAQVGACLAGIIAMASAVGYVYGVPRAQMLLISAGVTPMALHTAVAILLLSGGVALARPEIGLVKKLSSTRPGGTLLRRLLAPAILLPLVVGFLLATGEDRGLYGTDEGTAIFAAFLAAMLLTAIWWTANAIDRSDAQRRSVEARSRAVLETAVDGVITIDAMGRIIDSNSATEAIFGYSRAELIDRDMAEMIIPEHLRAEHRAGLARILNRPESFERLRFVSTGMHSDGSEFPVEISIGRPEGTEAPLYVGNIRDISKAVKLESDLRQAQKMEAVGQLAGGIAHDFNNLLTVILGYGELAKEGAVDGVANEDLNQMTDSAERASDLVRQLLAFSRQQVLAPEVLNIHEVVSGVLPMLEPLIGEDITVKLRPEQSPQNVFVDRGQLEQVLVNLAVNARDAMPTGGELTIAVRPYRYESEYGEAQLELEPGDYVCLTVSDTGTGIDDTAINKIFEPFFTTKEVGSGTGLGLATVQGIVSQSGGDIHVYSERDIGTTFNVYLPSTSAIKSGESQPIEPSPIHDGNERVLVCEDDEHLNRLIDRILTDAGYEVLSAATPSEALAVMEETGGNIDVLLTDVIMPEMSGPQLAERIAAMSDLAHLPVLLVSGYTPETVRDRGRLPAGSGYVVKPFDRETLLANLRDVVDR